MAINEEIHHQETTREPVLSPVDRVSEMLFGLFMALKFVGAISVAESDSYFYAWSELGFRPVDWLRVGIAGQRTRTYSNERDIQRGPFAQITWGPVTIGSYWFNPGSIDQVFVGMISAMF